MSETREFPLGLLLTATTGCLLVGPSEGGFGAFQEFAEFLTSGPVWTHEFASREFSALLKNDVLRQHPDLPTEADVTPETWGAWLEAAVAKYGAAREVGPIPDYGRTKGPLTTAAELIGPDKVIGVVAP
jgi:hypothetical protein